jgi:hypothetical protein
LPSDVVCCLLVERSFAGQGCGMGVIKKTASW